MKVHILEDVNLYSISPQTVMVTSVLAGLEDERTIYVTSVTGGAHSAGTLHHHGFALDLDLAKSQDNGDVAERLRRCLPDSFDVIREDPHAPNDHIHVEWDPSGPA